MNPLTYLGFTIFSIIMQFCVMEFINERFQLDKESASFNESVNKKSDLIKDINRKPHALFYRTETEKKKFETHDDEKPAKYNNASLQEMTILTSTDISSTTFEVFFDNTTIIEDFFTTESYFTESEFDNVTEIAFDKSNTTTVKPSVNKKVSSKDKCFCNLLYQKCDINCCCDVDCTEEERSLFINCDGGSCDIDMKEGILHTCNSYSTCRNTISSDVFNDLFCIVKVNLPDKRIKSHFQLDVAALNATFKWNTIIKPDIPLIFKSKYEYGDPLWLLKNGVTSSLNLPITMTNDYCSGSKHIHFLTNENIKCYAKLNDLYMFSALKIVEGANLINAAELSNITVMNCSTLHCINWTILACNENICSEYNKTINVPMCTDNYCDNLAHTIEYAFYYFESKIINASMKLYLTKVPMSVPLLLQKITVKWYLGNESIDNIIQLSGNPGYIPGLPLIVSYATNNHTTNFYNQSYGNSFLPLPQNVNGQCNWSNIKNKTLTFGLNTRLKCRLRIIQNISQKNATQACQAIQTNIKERLRLNRMLYISPYGNPRDVSDDKWIPLEVQDRTFLYGQYRSRNTQLVCYNFVTRYAFVIAYADVSGTVNREENKVVKATADVTPLNITFDPTKLSTVLTIDIRFIDISRPIFEIARAPDLHIHLPANFFIDYPLNKCYHTVGDIVLVLHCLFFIMK